MQVEELLNEVKPGVKKTEAVSCFVEKLRSLLFSMKQGKREHQVLCDAVQFYLCKAESSHSAHATLHLTKCFRQFRFEKKNGKKYKV